MIYSKFEGRKTAMECQIDSLDRKILRFLQADSRTPFLEIARALKVSGGTIHARVGRMKDEGVIVGSKITVDQGALGYGVMAFVGIQLARAGAAQSVQEKLSAIDEIVEVHYTTGTYSLFVKVAVKTIKDLYVFLSERLQAITEIQSTETFVVLDTAIDRDVSL